MQFSEARLRSQLNRFAQRNSDLNIISLPYYCIFGFTSITSDGVFILANEFREFVIRARMRYHARDEIIAAKIENNYGEIKIKSLKKERMLSLLRNFR